MSTETVLEIKQFEFSIQCDVLKKQIERQTAHTLIRLLLKEQSDLGLHSFVRPTSPNT